MKRILIASTIVLLGVLTMGNIIGQDSLVQAFVSNEPVLQVSRVLMIGLLVSLFFTAPPRSIYFRITLGVSAAFLLGGVVAMALQYYMALLDALIFTEVAIIFALDALESPSPQKVRMKKVLGAYRQQAEKVLI